MLNLNPDIFPPEKISIILQTVGITIFIQILLFGIVLLVKKSRANYLPLTIVIVTTIDLLLYSTGNLITAPSSIFTPHQSPPNFGLSRYLSSSDSIAYFGPHVYFNHIRVRQPFAPDLSNSELTDFARLKKELEMLPANTNMFYDLFNANGYSAMVLSNYANYFHSTSVNTIHIPNLSSSIHRPIDINYFITGYPQDILNNSTLLELNHQSNNAIIYNLPETKPRTFFLKAGGDAQIVNYHPTKITISTQSTSPDQLILLDSYYPGWTATIDGNITQIHSFDTAFRSIDVPIGNHTIEFSYQPDSVKIGSLITAFTLLLTLIITLWPRSKFSSLFSIGMA